MLESFRQAQVLEGSGGRNAGQRLAVFQLLQSNLDGLLKLLVPACGLKDWIVIQEDVRIYAMVLYNPLAGTRTSVPST